MNGVFAISVVAVALSAIVGAPAFDADDFLARVSKMSPTTPQSEMAAIAKIAKENGKAVADATVGRLLDKSVQDDEKVAVAWILGLAKQKSSIPALVESVKASSPTSTLYHASLRALTDIGGGDEVGAVLLKSYRQNASKMSAEQRFNAMQSLAMLSYAPAVKDAEEFLKVDPERYYWQVYFIFGFFDDLAIPLLCEKLNDSDDTIRTNALGAIRFLMPNSDAVFKALLKRLETETEPDIRYQLVEALEWTALGRGEEGNEKLSAAFNRLLKTEAKDSATAKFMRETLAARGEIAKIRERFRPNAEKFNAAYRTLLDGGVHLNRSREAAQDILTCATPSDIPKLKELRRRVLYRQSDECFSDYHALTRIIQMVRLASSARPSTGG